MDSVFFWASTIPDDAPDPSAHLDWLTGQQEARREQQAASVDREEDADVLEDDAQRLGWTERQERR